jgi:hypothetical protein
LGCQREDGGSEELGALESAAGTEAGDVVELACDDDRAEVAGGDGAEDGEREERNEP